MTNIPDPLYREIILEHWKNPKNYGVIHDASIDIQESNPLCGDVIRLTMTITDSIIADVKFFGEGCAISKASASIFTEKIAGQRISEIQRITAQDTLDELGLPLTPSRIKCALLIYSATKKALLPY